MVTITEIVNRWYAEQILTPPATTTARRDLIAALEAQAEIECRRAHSDGFADGYREAVADEDKARPDMRKTLDKQERS